MGVFTLLFLLESLAGSVADSVVHLSNSIIMVMCVAQICVIIAKPMDTRAIERIQKFCKNSSFVT